MTPRKGKAFGDFSNIGSLRVNAGSGVDTIKVEGSSVNTSINGGDGNDTVIVGNAANTLDRDWFLSYLPATQVKDRVTSGPQVENVW